MGKLFVGQHFCRVICGFKGLTEFSQLPGRYPLS
jgi:hypothetical protein